MKEANLAGKLLLAVVFFTAAEAPAAVDPKAGAQTAAKDIISQCSEFPKGHPYSCENLAAMDLIKACNEFPADHPKGCKALAAMDMIKACNEFPPEHPKGCRALLSLAKCPPGTTPGVNCRHMLVQTEPGLFRDREGQLLSVAALGAVRTASVSVPAE